MTPGAYQIVVSAPTFSDTKIDGLQVTSSVITSANVVLQLGSPTTTVTVQAEGLTLQTDSGAITQTIGNEEVENLPIANLNPYSLALTLPGVTSVTTLAFTNGTEFSVFGTRPRANDFLIEGQDNNDTLIHGQGIQPGNLDAVKEVTFLTNSYDAEYGHGGGSVSNVIYKSGTNTFHGAAWDRLLNSSLDAEDKSNFITDTPKPKSRENIFGFDIGGPIVKDKLFFFGSYQWDNFRATTNSGILGTLIVPTDAGVALLQSLPSNPRITNWLTAIGNVRGLTNQQTIPLGIDPNTGLDRGNLIVGDVKRSIPDQSSSPELDLKGDWVATKSDTLSLRYIKTNFSTPFDTLNFPAQFPGFDTLQFGVGHNAGFTYSHIFSPTLLNEARGSYGREGFFFEFAPDTLANPLALSPTISISDVTGWGQPFGDPQSRLHDTYQLQDALSWTKGSHFIKVGFDASSIRTQMSYLASTPTARSTTPLVAAIALPPIILTISAEPTR